MADISALRAQLLGNLDEAFDGRGWHGPTLWGSVRSVTPECAAWRPADGRHNIWELAVHAAYWKHVALRRITGARERFWSSGTNWFARPEPDASWREDLDRLKAAHERLHTAVSRLPERTLAGKNAVGRDRVDRTIRGIAAHDVYHAGQIQLLKRLWTSAAQK